MIVNECVCLSVWMSVCTYLAANRLMRLCTFSNMGEVSGILQSLNNFFSNMIKHPVNLYSLILRSSLRDWIVVVALLWWLTSILPSELVLQLLGKITNIITCCCLQNIQWIAWDNIVYQLLTLQIANLENNFSAILTARQYSLVGCVTLWFFRVCWVQ